MTNPEPAEPDAQDITYAVAEATATHPEGTELDDNGDPVPDVQ
jgi:hypothetical protein